MSDPSETTVSAGKVVDVNGTQIVVHVNTNDSTLKQTGRKLLVGILTFSLMLNLYLIVLQAAEWKLGQSGKTVQESLVSGKTTATDRLAVIRFVGTISPPFTERWLKQIQTAIDDDSVKGVLLSIDSPGGLVADSHQLYNKLKKLAEKKPVYVSMKRIAASGGLYIAMAGGTKSKIFVEPTTWTGSIGVIIPRYNAAALADNIGLKVEPLATGPLKDSLNPFRNLSEQEQAVWDEILADSFDRFVGVIHENRSKLSEADVRSLATGQIYTARQAVQNGLADEIGYEETALEALAQEASLSEYSVIQYSSPQALIDLLLSSAEQQTPSPLETLLETSVPRAMYYCSWNPFAGLSRAVQNTK